MKKITRFTSMLLTGILVSALLAGCSNASGNASVSSEPADSTPLEGEKLGVALIVNGNIGDKSFNDLSYEGLQRAAEEFAIDYKLVENNYDTTKYEPSIIEFAENPDYDLLILNSADVKEIVERVAPQYPDKKFILYDSDVDYSVGDLSNVYSMTFKQNEASFLAGALAAKITSAGGERTNPDKLIGFIAGGENVIINDFLLGYIEGAQYADPDVKMLISYIGDFKNVAKGKEMALAQIMQNADVIFQVAANAGIGVEEAAEEKGVWAIGVDDDHYMAFKDTDRELAETIVSSVVKNVDDLIYNCMKRYVEGRLPFGETEALGLKEGMVGLAKNEYYESIVPDDIRTFIEETEKKISSGEVAVGTNIGQPVEVINDARNSIKP